MTRTPERHEHRETREASASPSGWVERRAWRCLLMMSDQAAVEAHRLRRELGGLSRQQLKRVIMRARCLVRPYSAAIVCERYALEISPRGGPRWVFYYRLTRSLWALTRLGLRVPPDVSDH